MKKYFMQEIVIGKISLFGRSLNSQDNAGSKGQAGTSITYYPYYWYDHNELFVQQGFQAAKLMNQASLFKGFEKKAAEYFGDCPDLVEKLKGRELKKADLKEIADFYNANCG